VLCEAGIGCSNDNRQHSTLTPLSVHIVGARVDDDTVRTVYAIESTVQPGDARYMSRSFLHLRRGCEEAAASQQRRL